MVVKTLLSNSRKKQDGCLRIITDLGQSSFLLLLVHLAVVFDEVELYQCRLSGLAKGSIDVQRMNLNPPDTRKGSKMLKKLVN